MTALLTTKLNPQQHEAATWGQPNADGQFTSEPLLIIAGAGTGKTNTLAHRAAHLILQGIEPQRILLMTFSRRAAAELVSRCKRIVAASVKQQLTSHPGQQQESGSVKAISHALNFPWMGTFHSVANRLLRQFSDALGIADNFSILDRNDSEDLIDILRFESGFAQANRRFPKKSTCLNIYSRCVNAQQSVETVLQEEFPWCSDWANELRQLFRRYSDRKIKQASLDYDDLLLYWYHLAEIPEVQTLLRNQFDHILIDEYQDTNLLQAGILLRLFGDGKGVTVVGDDAQSIYRFRSAEIDNILKFPEQFTPHAKIIKLEQNYRSTQPILDLANQLLAESKTGYHKQLWSTKKQGIKPAWVSVEDDAAQAEYIVEEVLAQREKGIELRQQAVLFRSSHHSDRLEVELLRRDIPFIKYGGLKFLEAAHVKDFLSILRWADNPQHRLSGFRLLKLLPGVGVSTANKALDFLELHQFQFKQLHSFPVPEHSKEDWQRLVDCLQQIQQAAIPWPAPMELARDCYLPLMEAIYEDDFVRKADIEQLIQLASQFSGIEGFVSELTLDPPISSGDLAGPPHKDDDFLILSTIHSAKGQEWNNVFILNVADGNIPNEYATDNPKAMEEERRLLNVAITRAKQQLHLIQPLKYWVPEQPRYGDKHVYGAKSRFFSDAFCALMEKRFYPSASTEVKEPLVRYDVLGSVQNKIRQMW